MKNWYCAVLLAVALNAQAQGTLEGIIHCTPSSVSGSVQGNFGWAFRPTTSMDVVGLGAFQFAIADNLGNLNVGLWNAAGANLITTNVTSSSPAVNSSRYVSIAPIGLTPGSLYYITVWANGPLTSINAVGPQLGGLFTNSPLLEYIGMAQAGMTNMPPSLTPGAEAQFYAGPNLQFVVPEPGSLSLLGLGLGTLWMIRRGRRN